MISKDIVISTCAFIHENLTSAIKLSAKAGFEAIELWADPPHAWPRAIKGKEDELKKIIEENKVRILSVCPLFAPWGGMNLAHYNDGIRQESVKQVKECIKMGYEFKANLTLVVPGWIYSTEFFPREKAREYAISSIRECAELAKDHDMKIGLENTLTFVTATDLLKIIKEVNVENVGVYVDVVNALQAGISPVKFIEELGETIVGVHLSDLNDGGHLAIGKGKINFDLVIKALRKVDYTGDFTFEIFGATHEEIVQSRKRIEGLIEEYFG